MTSPSPLPTDEDALVRQFADGLFAAGLRSPDSTRAVIVFKEVLAGFRRSVVSTPNGDAKAILSEGDEVLVAYQNAARAGDHADALARALEKALDALEASAVSAPPTITDEALARVMHADDVDKGRAFSTFEAMDAETQAWYFDNARAFIAHLSTRAALGGEA